MASDEPAPTGGTYRFVEPQGGCIVPRMGDPERSAAIRNAAANWRGEVFFPRKGDPAQTAAILVKARAWYNRETTEPTED